ncbi:hypothetical protein GALMADRAFT_155247 [Galerina marginata CBS 339.88]|uniref:CDC20/Fizzy WD40 domain-containing protein n=1 Tax=Galerina marginata (strain CBS 339.88) TaxID=685588 RepID=A0A067TEF7_GALM3|nr:hypothetical protein GALMADRAFT_155247 [Galerina marginata CBS 339.88]
MSSPGGTNDCIFETPTQVVHSRKRIHDSVTNLRSHKRRRVSMASIDLGRDLDVGATPGGGAHVLDTADRFISNRPKIFLPLNITPRTKRISKQFGLVDDRVLHFKDDTDVLRSTYRDETTMSLLRRSASSLFSTPPPLRPTSVTENLNKRRHCLMVLDSPGVPSDQEAYPITWSCRNLISVACKNDIYYQNLDNKSVSHLCTTLLPGKIGVIQWGQKGNENYLALGMSSGTVQMWDAGTGGRGVAVHTWFAKKEGAAKCLSWNQDVLAIGMEGGEITLTDVRCPQETTAFAKHRDRVLGLQWSPDGNYLASGDKDGIVHLWDRRAGKSLLDSSQPVSRIRHKGGVKALAWCPWKPELLATGSAAPEGKIKIWNISSMTNHSPEPIQTIPLNTSVLSLHWSPHCKELLSTHGSSFKPLLSPRDRTSSVTPNKLTFTKTPLTNSITVHEYPSCKRLMTLTNAHSGQVTHSCLGPSGESIFTVSPREEAIKMWQVWSRRAPAPKRESAFDKYTIR